jgi:hypothetical protein
MNNNLNNDLFINPTKLFINKIWKENIIKNYDQGLNNLNSEFNQNLVLKPKNISDFDTGTSYDNYFNKEYFGIKSLKKIKTNKKYNNSSDNFIVTNLNNIELLQYNKNLNKKNKIESVPLYKYSLDISSNSLNLDILNDNIEFVIDYHTSDYKNEDPIIKNPEILNNTLIFYSDKIIKNAKDLSLIIKNKHTISNYNNFGKIYSCNLNDDINIKNKFVDTKDFNIYYNTFKIDIINYDSSNNKIEFVSNDSVNIESNDFVKVEKKIGLDYFTIIDYSGNNITKLNFIGDSINNFYSSSLTNYININFIDYKILYNNVDSYYYLSEDISNTFSLTTVIDKKININKIYNIFKFSYTSSTNTSTNNYFEIDLDTAINLKNNGNNNYSINISNTLSKYIYINSTKIGIYYDINDTLPKLQNYILTHTYYFNESNNYLINKITNNELYLYNINPFFTVNDIDNTYICMYDGLYQNFDSSGNYYSYKADILFNENNLIKFTNNIKNNEIKLNNYGINVQRFNNLTNIKKIFYKNGKICIHLTLSDNFWTNSYTKITSLDYNDVTNIIEGTYITNTDYNLELSQYIFNYNNSEIYNSNIDGLTGTFYVYSYNSTFYLYFESADISLSEFYIDLFKIEKLEFKETLYSSKEYMIGNISNFENVDTSGNYIYIPDQSGNTFFTDIYSKINQTNYEYYLMYDNDTSYTKLNIDDIYYETQLVIKLNKEHTILNKNYYLFLKLKDIDINEDIYHYMYNLTTNDNVLEHNINDYFVPQIKLYDSDIKEIKYKNEYSFNLNNVDSTDTELINTIDNLKYLNVKINGDIQLSEVLVLYKDASNTNLINYEIIIGTNSNIRENINYSIYSLDYTYTNIIFFKKRRTMFNSTKFHKYNSKTSLNLFVQNEIVTTTYTKDTSNNIVNLSNFDYYLNFKNDKIILNNDSYKDVGYKKIEDIIIKKNTEVEKKFDAKWLADTGVNIFKKIEFIIDNNVVDKLNHHIYKILYNYNYTIYKEGMFKMLNGIKYNNDNNIYFYVPLKFFFSTNSAILPVCAMRNSSLKIKFYINKIENLISNYSNKYTITEYVKPEMDIYYETIYLEKSLVKKFSEKYLYLAQVSNIYSQNYLTKNNTSFHLNINNVVKDIFFIIEGTKSIKSYDRDIMYNNYLNDLEEFTNGNSKIYTENYKLFTLINNEINTGSIRINTIKLNNILSQYDIKYILYIDEKYLKYINENLNNISTSYSNKITILTLYFLKNYKNKTIYNVDNGIIQALDVKINGNSLGINYGKYFNSIIPYQKGYKLLDNYYVYSFGLDSKATQPNGSLNFKNINDVYINTILQNNDGIKTLYTYTREYKIFNIENNKCKILN